MQNLSEIAHYQSIEKKSRSFTNSACGYITKSSRVHELALDILETFDELHDPLSHTATEETNSETTKRKMSINRLVNKDE